MFSSLPARSFKTHLEDSGGNLQNLDFHSQQLSEEPSKKLLTRVPQEQNSGCVHGDTQRDTETEIGIFVSSLGLFIFCLSLKGRRLSLIQMNPYKPRGVPALALSVLTLAFLPLSTPYRDV